MPMTGLLSKQVIPVYDKPMIYYPLSVLMLAEISEILVISSPEHLPQIKETILRLGNLGVRFEFIVQQSPDGIAQALILGEDFLDGSPSALILGDNIFFGHGFSDILQKADENGSSAQIFVHQVNKPEQYGVIELSSDDKIMGITEKPVMPRSNLAVTGLYFFDKNVVNLSKKLKSSKRKELEIVDLLNKYKKKNKLSAEFLGRGGAWLDAGSIDDFYDTTAFVSAIEKRQGFKIACLEEISLRKKWISKKEINESIKFYGNCEYSKYLRLLIT